MKINSKGQAEAVFEVLIAVILLSFVLVVGSVSMKALSNNKCSKEIDISLKEFAFTIESVSSSALSSKSYLFSLPNCFGPNSDVRIINEYENSLCSAYCPGSSGGCYLLRYDNNKDVIAPTRYNCINISSITILNGSSCVDIEDASKVTGSQANGSFRTAFDFKRGKYIITSASLQRPNICIYRQE